MKKQGIICPNCGAEITAMGTLMSECPYCGGIVANEQRKNDKRTERFTPKRIIPFLLNKDGARQAFLNSLVERDFPVDIFDNLSIKDIHKVYVPMYRYNGTINVSWSGTVVYERRRTIGDKIEYYEEYHPISGNANSNFNILCLAIDENRLPKEVQKLTGAIEYDSKYSKSSVLYDKWALNEEENVDAQIIWPEKDEANIWDENESINEYIDRRAYLAARSQAPFNTRDFSFTCNSSASHGELILFPIWIVYYSYKDEDFCFTIDGLGYVCNFSVPVDEVEEENIKCIEEDEKQRLKVISNKSSVVIWSTLAFLLISLVSYGFNSVGSILLALICIFASIFFGVRFREEKKAVKSVAKCRKKASESIAKYQRMIGKARYCNEPIPDKPQGTDAQFEYEDTKSDKLYICILFLILVFFSAIALSPLFFQDVESRNNLVKDEVYKQAEKTIVEVDSACCDSTVAVKDMNEKVSTSTNTSSINSVSNVEITSAFAIRIKRYNELGTFSEGLALVRRNGKWGYIDIEGNEVIPCKFDGEEYGGRGHDFSDGLAVVVKNGKHGYIDKKGEIVINADYDEAGDFSEGIACVQENFNDELTFIDKKGNSIDVLSGRFVWDWNLDRKLPKFRNGICKVHVKRPKDERYEGDAIDVIWINSKGEQVPPPQIKDVDEDLVRYWIDDDGMSKVGYKDREGNIIVPARYSSIGEFSQGVAVAILRYGTRANSGMVSDGYIAYFGYVDMEGNDTFSNEEFQKIYNAYRDSTK